MHEAQRVQQHVQRVRAPEPRVGALADHRVREHEDHAHYHEQQHAAHACQQKGTTIKPFTAYTDRNFNF